MLPYTIIYCISQQTVQCTVSKKYILYCTLHHTLHYYTIYKHQREWRISINLLEMLSFLPIVFVCLTQYFTIYCILYCIMFFKPYCKPYCTLHCMSCYKKAAFLISQEIYPQCLLFDIPHTWLYTALYTLKYIVHCTVYLTLYCILVFTALYTIQGTGVQVLVELASLVRKIYLLFYVFCSIYFTIYCLLNSTLYCTANYTLLCEFYSTV